ncbi:MAG TPA: GTP-binding protein [Casimicrobiaceae bacterium]|nr:GTP-binding protein [Casimicrobiaceae bacterium]
MLVSDGSRREPRVPVVLVTGFLGSGKTTLVNRLLKAPAFARAAVVVNEFGTVSIDHLYVSAPAARTRVIDSGCLCGHVHEQVASSLLDLHARRGRDAEAGFDCVLIETSGLADPVPIIQIITTDPAVSARFDLRTVVTVVDGVHGRQQLTAHDESRKQAAIADTLVISKIDIASAAELDALAGVLQGTNPCARQIRAVQGRIDAQAVLDGRGFSAADRSEVARQWLGDPGYAEANPPAGADLSIRSFVLRHEGEITVPGLVLWMNLIAGMRGRGLLRVKGIANVEGRPYAIQAVQTVVSEPQALDGWPDDDRGTRLVFITRGMDPAEVERTFATFDFDAGRAPRNTRIDPATYRRFAETMELFRGSSIQNRSNGAIDDDRNVASQR